MTTTVAPAVGATPSFTQTGTGASPGYSAVDLRRLHWAGPMQEGVIDSGSFEVVQRAAGANMSVDIASNSGNGAVVQGDSITSQGLYYVSPTSALVNEVITAADATNPRIDQVILEVKDDTHDAGGLNLARVRIVNGTATSGATLDNRTGAASLPSSAVRLADVLVAATDTAISNTEIRDRRPWARGAHKIISRNQDASAGNDYEQTTATYGNLDGTNLAPRLECSGVPVRLTLTANFENPTGSDLWIAFAMDGTIINGATTNGYKVASGTDADVIGHSIVIFYTPAAGSHYFAPQFRLSSAVGTGYVHARSDEYLYFEVAEDVRQEVGNNATTSG